MKVTEFEGTQDVGTIEELRAVLAKRFLIGGSQVNSFELSHDSQSPMMNILVKDGLASIWYTADEDSPGSNSVGSVEGVPKGEGTVFYFHGEREWVPNESIVSMSEASYAAEEFFASGTRPTSVRWLDL
jgi:hypothetical protein